MSFGGAPYGSTPFGQPSADLAILNAACTVQLGGLSVSAGASAPAAASMSKTLDGVIKTATAQVTDGATVSRFLTNPSRTPLLRNSADMTLGSYWAVSGPGATGSASVLTPYGRYVTVGSGGATWHRVIPNGTNIAAGVIIGGQTYTVTFRYAAGTSGKVYMEVWDGNAAAGHNTNITGTVGGAISVGGPNGGPVTNVQTRLLDASLGLYETTFQWTPNTDTNLQSCGIGPNSTVAGETINVYGFQIELGSTAGEFIATGTSLTTRSAHGLAVSASAAEPVSAFLNRENLIANSALVGAVAGTGGGNGTLPTGWSATTTQTTKVLATGVRNGIPYMQVQITHTNNTGANSFPGLAVQSVASLLMPPSTEMCASMYAKLVSWTGVRPWLDVQSRQNGSFLSSLFGPSTALIPDTWQRIFGTGTTHASTNDCYFAIDGTVPNGTSIDWVIEIGCPQLEHGTRCGDPVLTTGVAATAGYPLASQLINSTAAVAINCDLKTRTNFVPNSGMAGATSSTLPTSGWGFQAATGITQAVVGTGTEYGLNYIDWSLTGTASGTVFPGLFTMANNVAAAVNGQTWTSSIYYRVMSGALPPNFLALNTQLYSSAPAFLGNVSTTTATGTDFSRVSTTGTIANGSAGFVRLEIGTNAGIPNGTTVNVVIRVYAPQLEISSEATPFISTSSGVGQGGYLLGDTNDKNWVANAVGVGAAVTGNVLPTGWAEQGVTGITRTVTGVGVGANGAPYVEINLTGTNSTGGQQYWAAIPQNLSSVAATTNQPWTSSCGFELVAGSWPVLGARVDTIFRNIGGTSIDNNSFSANPGVGPTRLAITHSTNLGTVSYVTDKCGVLINNGETVNVTFRLYLPQLEQNAYATAPIATDGAARTRGAQGMTLYAHGLPYDRTGTVWATLTAPVTTNFNKWSQALNNAVYGKTDISVVAAQAIAPDGTATADQVIIGTGTVQFHEIFQNLTWALNDVVCGSVFVKKGSARYLQITGNTVPFGTATFNVDLQTGTITNVLNVTATSGMSYGIQDYGNGWYRIWIASQATSAASGHVLSVAIIQSGTSGRGPTTTGNGTDDFYIWGMQQENGVLTPSPYVPTTTAAVAVAAHGLSISAQGSEVAAADLGKTLGSLTASATVQAAVAAMLRKNLSTRDTIQLTRSTDNIGGSPWGKGADVTWTQNAGVAPDGSNTAQQYAAGGTGTNVWTNQAAAGGSTSGVVHCGSVFVKAGTLTLATVQVGDGPSTNRAAVVFNLATKTFNAPVTSGTGVYVAHGYEDWGNGWYRIWIAGSYLGTAQTLLFNHGAGPGTTGNMYFWGPQLEVGSAPTPFIPNGSPINSVARTGWGLGLSADAHLAGTITLANGQLSSLALAGTIQEAISARLGKRNLLDYSNFTWASKTGDGSTYTVVNGQTDRYGGLTASTLTDTSTSARNSIANNSSTYTMTQNATYTVSVEVKKAASQTDTAGDVRPTVLRVDEPSNANPGVNFNALTGAISNHGTGVTASGVVDNGDGFWTVWWTFKAPSSNIARVSVLPAHNSAATNTGSVTIGDMQFEEGATRTAIERVSSPTQGKFLANLTYNLTAQATDGVSLFKTLSTLSISSTGSLTDAANLTKTFAGISMVARGGPINRRYVHVIRTLR